MGAGTERTGCLRTGVDGDGQEWAEYFFLLLQSFVSDMGVSQLISQAAKQWTSDQDSSSLSQPGSRVVD